MESRRRASFSRSRPPSALEVHHVPERDAEARDRVRLEYHRLECFAEDLTPLVRGSREFSTIEPCQSTSDPVPFWHHEIEDVHAPLVTEHRLQARENVACVLEAEVMEEAVDQHEIEPRCRSGERALCIDDGEVLPV